MRLLMSLKMLVKMMVLRGLMAVCAPVKAGELIVLCYHSVPNRNDFTAQMTALAQSGYPVLSMDELRVWLSGAKSFQTPAVLLTFDDCYLNQFENAIPVLQSFVFPAVFFPVSGYVGKHSSWAQEFANVPMPALPLMDKKHLVELANAGGYTIGCHTHTHPHLTRLLPEQAEQEVRNSKRAIEDLLGQPVNVFCYPYGDHNATVVGIVQQAGFDTAFTVERGVVRPGDDKYRLKRIPVLGEPNPYEFRFYLHGAILLYWKLRHSLR